MQITTVKPVRRVAAPPVGSAQALLRSLEKFGIPKRVITDVLPAWWDNSIADDPSGLLELKVMLARRFSLDPKSIIAEGGEIQYLPVMRLYKGGRDDLMAKLGASTGIASAICRTALSFVGDQVLDHLKDPVALREQVLRAGAANVGLGELLEICWKANIPVLHVTLPENLKKFDALVTSMMGRHAVALCRNEDSEAWLAFHIAHELGHIACGHLEGEGLFVDEKIGADTALQELEANEYAAKLMGSYGVETPKLGPPHKAAIEFAALAQNKHIVPGHLVLKAGSEANNFGAARAVLKRVELRSRARQMINERSVAELSTRWNYDAEEYISQFFYKAGV